MNSVLLTGATGFIGRRIQLALLDSGYRVHALIRPSSGHRSNLIPGVKTLTTELSDEGRIRPAVEQADAVIYCAGSVRGRNLDDFRAANVDGVASLVSTVNRAAPDTPFLLISSLAASRPDISDYANSKYLGERELIQRARFPWSIFRPPAVYGPGDREMLPILKLARKGLVTRTGPSEQRLSLIHVDDLASAVVAWMKHTGECREGVFSLDDGRPGGYTWREIGEISSGGRHLSVRIPGWILSPLATLNLLGSRLFGYAPMLTPGKVRELSQPDWLCDNDALREATGWLPETDLEQGLSTLFGHGT